MQSAEAVDAPTLEHGVGCSRCRAWIMHTATAAWPVQVLHVIGASEAEVLTRSGAVRLLEMHGRSALGWP